MMQQVKWQPIDSQLMSLASVNFTIRAPDVVVGLQAGVGGFGNSGVWRSSTHAIELLSFVQGRGVGL